MDRDCTEFEVATMESEFGRELPAAAAATAGRPGYRTAEDLDRIIPMLLGALR